MKGTTRPRRAARGQRRDATNAFYGPRWRYFEMERWSRVPGRLSAWGTATSSLWWFADARDDKAATFNRDAAGIGHIGIQVGELRKTSKTLRQRRT